MSAQIVSCADKGLTQVPQVELAYRQQAKLLVLDGNELTDLSGFDIEDWPSLQTIWVRDNPDTVCTDVQHLKTMTKRVLSIRSPCTDTRSYDKEESPATQNNKEGSPATQNNKEESPATQNNKEVPPATHDNKHMRKRPTAQDGNRGDNPTTTEGVRAERAITTAARHIRIDGGMVTVSDVEVANTTAGQSGITVGLSFDWNGVVMTITIPVMMLGISAVVIKVVWKKRNMRKFDVDFELKKIKLKSSPTPSSAGSEIMFDVTDSSVQYNTSGHGSREYKSKYYLT